MRGLFVFLFCVVAPMVATAFSANAHAKEPNVRFRVLVLNEEFHSEGADVGDFNSDGVKDVVSGPFWYEGPDFRKQHRYVDGERFSIKAYSKHFFSYVHDFNADGRDDILAISMPGEPAVWFENPGGESRWVRRRVLADVGNESPVLTDLTGDGNPELVCCHGGAFGFAKPNPKQPNQLWDFTPVSANRGLGRFTHGLGVGDVDGDGRMDVLETNGWHSRRSPNEADKLFTHHEQRFAQAGGAQMFAYDFDGDGDNDVLATQNAHAFGLTWFERRGTGDDFLWVPHPILSSEPSDGSKGLTMSQMHGVALADVDGDGIKDIITGKRFFAHGGNDPGAFQTSAIYWFRTKRSAEARGGAAVEFEPHLIHNRVGVGTQLTAKDTNGDDRVDIVVGNKLGTFVLINEPADEYKKQRGAFFKPPPKLVRTGTDDFSRGVREDPPRVAEDELATFVLPEGFEAHLFASEPDIAKPLNMAMDAAGRMWVTCTLEYPYPVKVGEPGRDFIKVLEDTDGDGRADKFTTFADGLNIPMGLYPYKDGVICYSIPNIWFLRDTDGDGKCDKREKLYGPFDHTRDVHGMCNAFTRGYDGWLYSCHGFNNQSQVKGADGNEVTMHSGNTFRMRLDGSRIEHFTHGQVNPFGMAFDSRGDLFTADCHTKPVTLLMQGGFYDSFGKPHDGIGYVPDVMNHLHGSTGIGGIAITRDESRWPPVFRNNTFGGNVMTGRVNRNRLVYEGGEVRAVEEPDFLVSGDSWFRPVDLQFGFHGELYIADFYNRIIGHYEVPLDHPGRDRHRGRIWTVTYNGSSARRDTGGGPPSMGKPETAHVAKLGPAGLVHAFRSRSPAKRMLAADRLCDEFGVRGESAIRGVLRDTSAQVRVHALWALYRTGTIREDDIEVAIGDESDLVRAHVQRIIGDSVAAVAGGSRLDGKQSKRAEWLVKGLYDTSPFVQRVAAGAAGRHVVPEVAPKVVTCLERAESSASHLRHALRMSLRDHCVEPETLSRLVDGLDKGHVSLVADVCLGVKTEAAANFVVANVDTLKSEGNERLAQYMTFAARYAGEESVDGIVSMAQDSFSDDVDLQLELLDSINRGLKQRGLEPPASLRQWALGLADKLIGFDEALSPIGWSHLPHPETGKGTPDDPTWAFSSSRKSVDGMQSTPLWSSFPNGEQRTGVFRSGGFELQPSFAFYCCGHDGYPEVELQRKNLVRIRDAKTHQILKAWSPPRNDTAQRFEWKPGDAVGTRVYVELVDGDTAGAFAWMAAGRFSDPRLNPSDQLEDRRKGCEIVSGFRLTEMREKLVELVLRAEDDVQTQCLLAEAIASLSSTNVTQACADTLYIASLPEDLRKKGVVALCSDGDDDVTIPYLDEAMKYSTAVDRLRIVKHLASTLHSCDRLFDLVQRGSVNASYLTDESVWQSIQAYDDDPLIARWKTLTEGVESQAEAVKKREARLDALIRERVVAFGENGGDANVGMKLFEKHCANCHQVAGKGSQVGPNLDGIGNRGLERVTEDVLAPNRNVDLAFRATTIATEDGQVITGLLRGEDGAESVIFDSQGKEVRVRTDSIEDRKQSRLSPMPANFAGVLSEREFRDLTSYVLTFTK